MNIFSNIGITELVVILLLALLVVGPERLPEMGRKLALILRDLRKAYDNLTRELGPEMQSIQQTTRELRESVDSVRSIPKDMVKSVVDAAELDDTIAELKGVTQGLEEVRRTATDAGKMIKNPVGAAVDAGRSALLPSKAEEPVQGQIDAAASGVTHDAPEEQASE
jgi:sec-independent protein translocase protein TatB